MPPSALPRGGAFRSLRHADYRLWAAGALVSNIGTWMQRTAQDWLVLTQLTPHNAVAVGTVMSLQFGPQLVLMPWTGLVADRYDRRRLLFITQAAMGLLALILGVLTLTGRVRLWQVDLLALGLGCVSAFDTPARLIFVSALVEAPDLPNAVALNSTSFNAARLIGPATAGLLISAVGTGWLFILNAGSYVAVIASLAALRVRDTRRPDAGAASNSGLLDGLRYVRERPDLYAVMLMLFLIGTFGLNFPIFISTMSVRVFGAGAGQFGALTSMLAAGSVIGALLAARRERPRLESLVIGAGVFGCGCALAAVMPNFVMFGLLLTAIGIAAQTFTTTANAMVQLGTEPEMRGRVMAIYLAIAVGTTPLGAPIVGWVADAAGPRWAMGVGAAGGMIAAWVGWRRWRQRRDAVC